MALTEIKAGAMLDAVSPAELREVLRSWHAEIGRGLKFAAISADGPKDGAGNFAIAVGPPEQGFMWAVTSIYVGGSGFTPAADTFTAYRGDVSPYRALLASSVGNPSLGINPGAVVLHYGEPLMLAGKGTGAGSVVVGSIGYAEVPTQLAFRLLS